MAENSISLSGALGVRVSKFDSNVFLAQLDAGSTPPGWQHSFMENDHEIFSTVLLSLPLNQEGQLLASGERMYTILVNRIEDKACPVKVWLG